MRIAAGQAVADSVERRVDALLEQTFYPEYGAARIS
jgi:hypothetical protein